MYTGRAQGRPQENGDQEAARMFLGLQELDTYSFK